MKPIRGRSLRGIIILALLGTLILQQVSVSAATSPLFDLTLKLDGVDDYASAPDSPSLDLGTGANDDFTLECFFYVPDLTNTTNDTLIWKNGAYGLYVLYYTSQADRFIFRVYTSPSNYVYVFYDQDLDAGWHHVAAVFDNEYTPTQDLLALFLDGQGVVTGSGFDVSGLPNSPSALNLGAYVGVNPAVSWMEEVRLSDTVRYSGTTYTVPVAPFSPDAYTRALYHFDESWGATTFTDASGSGNALTGLNGAQIGNPPGTPPQPRAFGKTSPENSMLDQYPTSLTLSWETNPDAYDGYEYCFDTVNNNLCDTAWLPVSATQAAISGLNYSTYYYWQVRARYAGAATEADGGEWWEFFTIMAPPADFSKYQPADGAVDQPVNGLVLLPHSSLGAFSYEFCYDTIDDNLCGTSWTDVGLNGSLTLYGLEFDTTYYYQVRAVNPGGTTYANAGDWWAFTTQPLPPADFGKLTPADGAVDQPGVVHLSWEPSLRATSYEYCWDQSFNNECNSLWYGVGTNTSVDVSIGIWPDPTPFSWQVRARNGGGTTYANTGTFWAFTMAPEPPGLIYKMSPLNGAPGQPANLTLTWSSDSHAQGYEYCVDTLDNASCDAAWVSTGTATSANLTGLTVETTYYWQARAFNSGGSTYANDGSWFSFTTAPVPLYFTKYSPLDGATGVPVNDTLYWHPFNIYAAGFEVCYDLVDNDTCDTTWVLGSDLPNEVGSFPVTNLDPTAIYYWQIRAFNSFGATYADGGDWWSFTPGVPPGYFDKTNPPDAQFNVSLDPLLGWTGSSGATDYEVCYDTSNDNACTGWTSTAGATSMQLHGLSPDTTYYWQARANNLIGTTYSDASPTAFWSFTTGNPPGVFDKSAPQDRAVGVSLDPLLTWGASAGAVSYEYCLALASAGVCNDWHNTQASTSVQLSGLSPSTTYSWQVRAVNEFGFTYGNASSINYWSFTTYYRLYLPSLSH
jgi:hypothetical protein